MSPRAIIFLLICGTIVVNECDNVFELRCSFSFPRSFVKLVFRFGWVRKW